MIALLLLQFDALEEIEGRVVFEVESVAVRGDWKKESALAGFSGSGYFTWTGPDLFGAPGKDALSWTFHVSKPGRYRLLIRNRHDFEDSTLRNDCFTKMDEGSWTKTFSSTRGAWTWHTRHEHHGGDKPEAAYELSPGLHVLQISGRSKGFSLDRVHLALDGSQDLALPPSPTLLEALGGQKPRSGPLSPPQLAFLKRRADAARALDAAERVVALSKLAAMFKGSDEGAALAKEVDALRADPAVQAELKAAAAWKRVEEAVERLRPHNGARDPKSEGFRRLNAPAMAGIAAACERLVKDHPDTAAGKKAAALRALYR
jgi:hypothetical protein